MLDIPTISALVAAISVVIGVIFARAKDTRFKFAMICWSIGALAFSILLITSEVAPQIIGWLGIVASILVGFGTGIKLVKPKFKLEVIGALFAMLFEIIIGGWLLLSPLI